MQHYFFLQQKILKTIIIYQQNSTHSCYQYWTASNWSHLKFPCNDFTGIQLTFYQIRTDDQIHAFLCHHIHHGSPFLFHDLDHPYLKYLGSCLDSHHHHQCHYHQCHHESLFHQHYHLLWSHGAQISLLDGPL